MRIFCLRSKQLLGLLFMALIFSGCEKSDKLTNFDISYVDEVIIPAGIPVTLPFDVETPEITTNSETEFTNNNTRKDLIDFISLNSLELTITSPSGGNFDFLNSVAIYISSPNLDETKIAWKDNIPADGSQNLQLETTGANLKQYIIQDKYKLRVQTTTDELISSDYHLDVKTTFGVSAKLL